MPSSNHSRTSPLAKPSARPDSSVGQRSCGTPSMMALAHRWAVPRCRTRSRTVHPGQDGTGAVRPALTALARTTAEALPIPSP